MAAGIASTIVIERPRERVFAFLLDLENTRQWDPDVQTVRKTTPGPIGPGTGFEFYERTPPFGTFQTTTAQYTAVEPLRRIAFTAQAGPVAARGEFVFEQLHEGTRVTFRGNATPRGLLRLLRPLLVRQGRKLWDSRLATLKTWLEAHP